MDFGYPNSCDLCFEKVKNSFNSIKIEGLNVRPFYQNGKNFKLMLIGQDPTIKEKQHRVKYVLMLDQENSQLRRWLKGLFKPEKFDSISIYATNVVKCTFSERPSVLKNGGRNLLSICYSNCKRYLKKEIVSYSPDLILSLGEPSHELFLELVTGDVPSEMKNAFSGKFYDILIENFATKYSPCLHIQTFRVAETYGEPVNNFKKLINELDTEL